tara:strand:+ start:276 stop:503 length:228 start_codon:yes stop_codon:yes gene_type:complete
MPYKPMILSDRFTANIVCRFFMISGSKLLFLSVGVWISKAPNPLFMVFLPLSFLLFFSLESSRDKWFSLSDSKAF